MQFALRFVVLAVLLVACARFAQPSRTRGLDAPDPTFVPVHDITLHGATRSTNCNNGPDSTAAIQRAIDEVRDVGGGVVYVPSGIFCITNELRLYSRVAVRGAATAGLAWTAGASQIQAVTAFPAHGSMLRANDRTAPNEGVELENLYLNLSTTSPGVVGVDLSGISFSRVRGVTVHGTLVGSPLMPRAPGSVGFLLSDENGAGPVSPGEKCYTNSLENTAVAALDTAYKVIQSQGNSSFNRVANFWVADVMNGIYVSSIGDSGTEFANGYMHATALLGRGTKAWRVPLGYGDGTFINVEAEFFDSSDGPEPGQIAVRGNPGLTSATFAGVVDVGELRKSIRGSAWANAGASEASAVYPGYYPPVRAFSFWAKVPANTALTNGENQFVFYSTMGGTSLVTTPDLYFVPRVTRNGGLTRPISWSARASTTAPFGYATLTYTVSLYVDGLPEPTQALYRLPSDLVFFLDAGQSKPALN